MRNLWFALIVILVTAISASAETVFLENFSDGAGQFTGFQTSSCKWHTPGTASALIAYFGDDQYAEVVRSGCVLPVWNAAIESDAIDLTGYTGAELSFNHYFTQTGAISMGQASISLDGGETWQPVYTTDGTVTGEIQTIAIPQADGEPDVRIRFYFSYYGGALASSWGVDDVTVEASPLVDDDSVDDDVIDDDSIDDDVIDDDTADDDTADDDVTDDDAADDDAADDDTGDEETDIAYVYSVNLSRAEDFALFLNGEGYRVSLLQIAELDAAPRLLPLSWLAEKNAFLS